MRVVIFCHSLISDWNHGNAHFLRGVASELLSRGHELAVYEPRDAWSVRNLVAERDPSALVAWQGAYPLLASERYDRNLDLDQALDDADLVLVHEWNEPWLVAGVGEHRARTGNYTLLFHDTHHRSVSAPHEMSAYDLRDYDGVLAFGGAIRDVYLERGWAQRAWTWHEAADVRVFRPLGVAPDDAASPPSRPREQTAQPGGDLIFIGNWGDDERAAELREYLVAPSASLGLRTSVFGVRYPNAARRTLEAAGIAYGGWVPNYRVPELFARFGFTVHVPRRPYVRALPGVPTIRVFEALACGIPLICAPWDDSERLFTAGSDYLVARNGAAMRRRMREVLNDPELAASLAEHGRRTILTRHTCAHRVDELLEIAAVAAPALARRAVAS